MKRLIIHIGPHKTASTFIQAHLEQNRKVLSERGVCFPTRLRLPPGHHKVLAALKNRDHAALKELRQEIEPYEQGVLSSENFTHCTRADIAFLAEVFEGFDVRILFYYRELHEVWPSHWQERIKQGEHVTWPEYALSVFGCSGRVELDYVRPAVVLARWAKVFGMERIDIFPYSEIVDSAAGALLPLCDLLGVDVRDLEIAAGQGRNSSYPPERVEALRALNLDHRIRFNRSTVAVRRGYMNAVDTIERDPAFQDFREHFRIHARSSIIRADNVFIKHLKTSFVNKFGGRLMAYICEEAKVPEKHVVYLDPDFPVPAPIVEQLRTLIDLPKSGT